MAAVTLEELLKEVGVRPEILDESISDNHILVIASVLTSWRKVAAHLGLSEIDLDSLDQEGKSEQEKKLEALLKWKGRYAFKATYKKLIESLLSLAMADVAEKVCHLLKENEATPLSGLPQDQLSSDDLVFIMNCLRPIAFNWKSIGVQLGLSCGELNTIAATPLLIPGGHAAYTEEVLSRWLKHAPFPTLTDLCDALSAIGQKRIAYELKQQYQTEKAGNRWSDYPDLKPFAMKVKLTGEQLGTGAYASVEQVEIEGAKYAAKKFMLGISMKPDKFYKKFFSEFHILFRLCHSNVVQYQGICFLPDSKYPALVMEQLQTSLHQYLLNSHANLSLITKVSILHDVAKGLAYLHNCKPVVVHRDLTAKNILLSSEGVAKISDFGNSRIVDIDPACTSGLLNTIHVPGTLVYMPPEAASGHAKFNRKLDVFSFGHLALFTATQVFPSDLLPPTFYDDNGEHRARTEIERRQQYIDLLKQQPFEDHSLTTLIKDCLHDIPNMRPTADSIEHNLLVQHHMDQQDQVESSTTQHMVDEGIFTRTYWKLEEVLLTGEDTVIAILDKGINMKHSAFQWPASYHTDKPKVLPAPEYSRNFHPDQLQNDITDHTGHGTFCAGIAAGNPYDIAHLRMSSQQYTLLQDNFPGGVAPRAQLIVCRIDFSEGQVVQALDHLIEIQTRQVNPIKVDVVSLSFQFDNSDKDIEDKIHDLTLKHGTICVASVGNEGHLRHMAYPASCGIVISSGSSDYRGHQAEFSSTGKKTVYLAPGKTVLGPVTHTPECLMNKQCTCRRSLNHTSECQVFQCTCLTINNQAVKCASGTSYSTPAVAGLISLLIQLAKTEYNTETLDIKVIRILLGRLSLDTNEKGYRTLQPNEYLNELYENPGILNTLTRQQTNKPLQQLQEDSDAL